MGLEVGDRVEWHLPGQEPFSRKGSLSERRMIAGFWLVRWVTEDRTRVYETQVHENYIRKVVP